MPGLRLVILICIAALLAGAVSVPRSRGHVKDALAIVNVKVRQLGGRGSDAAKAKAPRGAAGRVIQAGRMQMGSRYVLGARPRNRWALSLIGDRYNFLGFDCSSFVAYAFQEGGGIWIGGDIAHTDEIWTQGGAMPLTSTADESGKVIRGTGAKPPPGGYRPGDILFRREGAGGYWGHVGILSERDRILESFPPDVHETRTLDEFLTDGDELGWMRVRALRAA